VVGVAVVVRVGRMSVGAAAAVVVVVSVGVRPVRLGMLVGVPVGVGAPASGRRGAGSADGGLTEQARLDCP
jgi:hypothetical protein